MTKNHKGTLTVDDIVDLYWDDWQEMLTKWLYAYADTYKLAMLYACRRKFHLVFFETLRKSEHSRVEEMKRIVKFISDANAGKEVPYDVDCLEDDGEEGHYHRKSSDSEIDWSRLFSEDQMRTEGYFLCLESTG